MSNPIDLSQASGIIYGELSQWIRVLIGYVPKVALAILIVFIFSIVARFISRWMVRGLDHVSHNYSLINLTGAVTRVVLIAIGLFIALSVLGLDKAVTSLLAGAGVIALAIGFAFQDLTANFISGTMIALARPIQTGDMIDTNGFSGTVLDIKLRSIVLDNGQGQTVEIPSKDVFQKPITNYSRLGRRRMEVTAGISYLDNLTTAQQVAQTAIARLPFVLHDHPVELHYRNFGDNMIQFIVWFWINPAVTVPQSALSEAIKTIRHAFDENQILILFPPQTYDLKQKLAPVPPVGYPTPGP